MIRIVLYRCTDSKLFKQHNYILKKILEKTSGLWCQVGRQYFEGKLARHNVTLFYRAAESCPHRPHVGSKACMVLVRKWLGEKKERGKKRKWGESWEKEAKNNYQLKNKN